MALVTKSELARMIGVTPPAVSNLIRRGKLTAPALRSDGKIDAERAAAQLRVTLNPLMTAAKRKLPDAGGVDELAGMSMRGPQEQLLRARALSAAVDAMKKRRDFMAESGKYTLTEQAEAAWAKIFSEFLLTVEHSLADMVAVMQATPGERDKLSAARRWWRNIRVRSAETASAAAAALPEHIEDNAA